MPITLTVNGVKTKVANEAIEAAFARAIAEVEPGEVLVSSAVAGVSKIAQGLGLAKIVWRDCGNGATAKQVAYPAVILDRVAAILGCDDLAGSFRHDPKQVAEEAAAEAARVEEELRARAEWVAERERTGHRHEVVFVAGQFGAAPWLARITGADPKYRFRREFEESTGVRRGQSVVWHLIHDGVYEVGYSGSTQGHAYFFELAGGVETVLSRDEVDARFPAEA